MTKRHTIIRLTDKVTNIETTTTTSISLNEDQVAEMIKEAVQKEYPNLPTGDLDLEFHWARYGDFSGVTVKHVKREN